MSLEQVRIKASRDDYPSMARLARALYETGLGPREVLRECYGVAFPDEFFVLHEANPTLLFLFTNQPANLAVPLDRGGPPPTADPMSNSERDALTRDPDLVPLLLCLKAHAAFGGRFLCYRLSELAAARSTVFTIERYPTRDSEITRGPRGPATAGLSHGATMGFRRPMPGSAAHAVQPNTTPAPWPPPCRAAEAAACTRWCSWES